MRRFALLLAVLCLGCPGKRRPPPWAEQAIAKQKAAREAARREAQKPPAPPPPVRTVDERLRDLQTGLKSLQQARTRLPAGDHAAWKKLVGRIDRLQSEGGSLQKALEPGEDDDDAADDPRLDTVLELLEAIGDLRAEVVPLEPKK